VTESVDEVCTRRDRENEGKDRGEERKISAPELGKQ